MDKKISDAIPAIVSKLSRTNVTAGTAFLGFDACIDNIVRIVRDKKDNDETEYFSTSSQLGDFLVNLNNKSCGLELQTKLSKIGGNMVIMGNALGNLGIQVECMGTFGFPVILPVFHTMSSNCLLHTIAEASRKILPNTPPHTVVVTVNRIDFFRIKNRGPNKYV